jgi:thiol-disulfide isomerase/thioredoxin
MNLSEAIKNKEPFYMYFYSNSCGVCYQLKPFIKRIIESKQVKNFFEINSTTDNTLTESYEVEYFPTVVYFDGKNYLTYVGNNEIKTLLNGI